MNILMSEAQELLARPSHDPVLFAFAGPQGNVIGKGAPVQVARGTATTLASRVARALEDAGPDALIGGALPFDRAERDCLWLCRRAPAQGVVPAEPAAPRLRPSLVAEPPAAEYARQVARALAIMDEGAGQTDALEKIVLARTLRIEAGEEISAEALMARLGQDPAVTAFRVALPPRGQARRALVGGTPELLVEKSGAVITSHPLAGSARREADRSADRAASEALLRSEKDQREHAFVVEYIMDTLAPWCRELGAPEGTTLTSTQSMWHLGTRITGRLKDPETPSVLLAALLHPTPAVCGLPMARAYDLIGELEPVPRDFYAGAVGWCDQRGDGAWHVAIRCAEVSGHVARLYAGAGIVPGSDPMAEAAETGAKFGALLAALGLPADAALTTND
ncbi:isochorismate synthase [Paracoccus sp. (in: a-proteobacteria)]|uniref:isochorismate synthase n=1 Tax=Paracoccus sp. TaxID=267 RepID=UPI002D7E84DE|nr:isochorismate synthase [Paracoccus sp. (in: a-proteobacteria)]